MASEVLETRTALTVEQVKRVFSDVLSSRKVEFGSIQPGDNPFAESADFEAYASRKTVAGGWIVQIYINDRGEARDVSLVAVGSTALGRAVGGLKNTYSLATSREMAVTVLDGLRAASVVTADSGERS